MQMLIDGVMVDVLDDAELLRFAERRAALRVGATPKHKARADLEKALVLGTFAATKFGALCASLKINPATPVERADLFLIADLMGEAVGLRLNLSTAEVHRVEDEAANEDAPADDAGDAGRRGDAGPVAAPESSVGGPGGEEG